MALVNFTPKPRRVTVTGLSTVGETMEVRGYRSLRLTLKVSGFEEADTPMLWVAMETSMRPDRDFASLGRFEPVAMNGGSTERTYDDIMRYVRWNVVRLDGAGAALFTLEGVTGE